jgi:hypothetical protein
MSEWAIFGSAVEWRPVLPSSFDLVVGVTIKSTASLSHLLHIIVLLLHVYIHIHGRLHVHINPHLQILTRASGISRLKFGLCFPFLFILLCVPRVQQAKYRTETQPRTQKALPLGRQ